MRRLEGKGVQEGHGEVSESDSHGFSSHVRLFLAHWEHASSNAKLLGTKVYRSVCQKKVSCSDLEVSGRRLGSPSVERMLGALTGAGLDPQTFPIRVSLNLPAWLSLEATLSLAHPCHMSLSFLIKR